MKRNVLLMGLVFVLLLMTALPTFASHQYTFISITCNASTQTVTLVVYNDASEDSPGFWVDFWANGVYLGEVEFDNDDPPYPPAGNYTFTYSNPAFAQNAVVTLAPAYGKDEAFEVTCSVTVPPAPNCPNPRPVGYTVKSIPAGALAFSAPSADAYTGFNLPAGQTWYTGTSSNGFTPVWIACQASIVWVPSDNVLP